MIESILAFGFVELLVFPAFLIACDYLKTLNRIGALLGGSVGILRKSIELSFLVVDNGHVIEVIG